MAAGAGARLAVALGLVLLAFAMVAAGRADAVMPETANPLPAKESTPLCSPECEVIIAPTEAASGREYEGGGPGGGFTPQELREAYGLPEHGGKTSTIAVIDGRGDGEAEADLAVYREHFGLPECTTANGCFRQLNEFGEPRHATTTGTWVGEISLDLDMVTAACPECRIDLFEGAGTVGLEEAIDTAVEMGANVVTNSWNLGFEEGNPANSGINCAVEVCVTQAKEEQVDRSLDHPGVPILFSGGDYGYGVRFPADSPYVISVGGTRLFHDAEEPRGWREEVWSNPAYGVNKKGRGTGGGCSVLEAKPVWETDSACTKRIENDVAAVADPRSPVSVYDSENGGWAVAGGTSAAAPFVAGVEGLSSAGARRLGAQAFWEAGEAGHLFDVAGGSNGECTPPAEDSYWCTAEVGYDAPTGWGTPDGPMVVESPPTVATAGATDQTQTTATLHGRVDNQGNPSPSACSFEIARGFDTAFSTVLQTVPCEPGSISGEGPTTVTAAFVGLSPRTVYAFRVRAENSNGGPVFSSAETFLTLPEVPAVVTKYASAIGQSSAQLEATVDNAGAAGGSTCSFRVVEVDDPSFAAPYTSLPCSPEMIRSEGATFVSAELSGLAVNTPYLFRVEATNEGGGPSVGATGSFRTLPHRPTVKTGEVGASTDSSATLTGFVDNEGAPLGSECFFEVNPSDEASNATPFETIPCEPASVEGDAEVPVSATAGGLSPATKYLFEVVAENAGGAPSASGWRPFTTSAKPSEQETESGSGSGGGTVIVTGPPDESELIHLEIAPGARVVTPPPTEVSKPSNAIRLGAGRVRGDYIVLPVAVPGPGTVTVTGGSSVRTTKARAIGAGSLTLRIPLSASTRRSDASGAKLRFGLRVTFAPTGGVPATRNISVTVDRSSSGR